jgi:hypothetical protein
MTIKFVSCGGLLLIACGIAAAQNPQIASVSDHQWTITADATHGAITIKDSNLGVLLQNAHLFVNSPNGRHELRAWQVQGKGGQLTIRTSEPDTGWSLEVGENTLTISSTEYDAELIADAPAPPTRILARLMDAEGAPVDWVGTGEVAGTYGGSLTHNRSFLPRRNPDVMYFALGQTDGSVFHSLFDRETDTAIDFGEGVALNRDPQNPDLLKISLPVKGSRVIRLIRKYYTNILGVPFYSHFDDKTFRTAPMVWSSWTSYYEDVTETDMTVNADWIATHLLPFGFEYVELDDGYDRTPEGHSWIEHWDRNKFPHGPQWLTSYIRARGLKAGIWLVPNSYAAGLRAHSNWYLYDKKGAVVRDYSTPALDSTNPEALEVVQRVFQTLDDWGFEYYKLDGEHALPKYAPPVDTARLHDPGADFIANYRSRLAMIRKTIGPEHFLEVCPAGTPLNAIGYANSYFNGDDVYNNWQGMYSLFSSIYANGFLNHLLVYVMPGEGIELGEPMSVADAAKKRKPIVLETERDREEPLTGFGVTDAEARTLVSLIALTGVAYPLASVTPELPDARVKMLQQSLPTLPIIPMDLFSRGTQSSWDKFKHVQPDYYIHHYPEMIDLKVRAAAGTYDVVGLTNWHGEDAKKSIRFADQLGLKIASQYVVFDFWNQKSLGVFSDHVELPVAAHDTRVLLIHPVTNHPQVIGLSRHISGSYSLLSQSWDSSRRALKGVSATVPGVPYSLWFRISEGSRPIDVSAFGEDKKAVPIEMKIDGDLLRATFIGQKTTVAWEVHFAAN